jgi:hypothetical protein
MESLVDELTMLDGESYVSVKSMRMKSKAFLAKFNHLLKRKKKNFARKPDN